MPAFSLLFTRANEPAAFNIPQERILDPVGLVQVGLREGAMESGAPSVTMIIPLAGGMHAVVETSLALWLASARAFEGRMQYWAEHPIPPKERS